MSTFLTKHLFNIIVNAEFKMKTPLNGVHLVSVWGNVTYNIRYSRARDLQTFAVVSQNLRRELLNPGKIVEYTRPSRAVP